MERRLLEGIYSRIVGPKSSEAAKSADLYRGAARAVVAASENESKREGLHFSEEYMISGSAVVCSTSRVMHRSSSSRRGRNQSSGSHYCHAPALLFHLFVLSSRCSMSFAAPAGKGRAQVVSVSAPWPTSCLSPLAEASEFVSEGDSGRVVAGMFWDYVEAVGDAPQWVFDCSRGPSGTLGGEATDEAVAAADAASSAVPAAEAGSSSLAPAASAASAGSSATSSSSSKAAAAVAAAAGGHEVDEAAVSVAAVSVAAVRAAGEGFGASGRGGSGAVAPGLGLDELSLRLLEVALSAR